MDKYNFTAIEKEIKAHWQNEQIFNFDEYSDKPLFVVDTPPPYVSADHLHAGHIMSYAQAEFIVRFKRMQGYNVYYPMGFDDNGLPTERFVEKKYNINKSKTTKKEFIELCLKETQIGAATYRALWNALGISVDWNKTYSTIDPISTKVSQKSLIDLFKKGHLVRKSEPMLWCIHDQTALAQADLEDKMLEGKLNYINFKSGNSALTIATTRPELLPACVAIYVNPTDKRYKSLIGSTAEVPIFGYQVPIKSSDKVDPEFGTGLMMVCTWGDQEDVEKWKEDNLDERAIIDDRGILNELAGKYTGQHITKAKVAILEELKENGYLIKQEDVNRPVNVHERCDTPVEFIKSRQWFISVKADKKTWLSQAKKINWHPKEKIKDLEIWIENLKWDWCISRQRFYGVPLPIWYCTQCDEPVFANIKDLPINPPEDSAPVKSCTKCGNNTFTPEEDVMDTWATSSVTPEIIRELVSGPLKEKVYPASVRPNAFEIIRTWDFYSIVKAYLNNAEIPFSNVMISGHGLDDKGHKFSKRLGNYKPAMELVNQYGADAIRYWATGALLGANLRFSESEVNIGHKTAVKLFNVKKLLDYYEINKLPDIDHSQLEQADLWILNSLNEITKSATKHFEDYYYSKAKDSVDEFFWSKFTDNYLEFIKYRLSGNDQNSKFAAIWCVRVVFLNILKLYAPILPFVTESIFLEKYRDEEKINSIHLSKWPEHIRLSHEFDKVGFKNAMHAVDEIRKYKSKNSLSLGKELDEYKLITKIDKKYLNFVEKVIRVKKII